MCLESVKVGYDVLSLIDELPRNEGGEDLYKRYLDCAVIEMAHRLRELSDTGPISQIGGIKPLPPYDTVRGAFWEGAPLYPSAGFKQKNHVQLCVRKQDCIKGYFRVLPD